MQGPHATQDSEGAAVHATKLMPVATITTTLALSNLSTRALEQRVGPLARRGFQGRAATAGLNACVLSIMCKV